MFSIPACAGEPRRRNVQNTRLGVYPRVCGGTADGGGAKEARQGLSPRVRGNRREAEARQAFEASIPACAGEPPRSRSPSSVRGVYPRVCGGTAAPAGGVAVFHGLSPRVRGNLQRLHDLQNGQRSIPACAGEPARARRRYYSRKVYPRVCGGTDPACVFFDDGYGLSPRVRGNPAGRPYRQPERGSIPACAGEPRRARLPPWCETVYPRVCGGTMPRRSSCASNRGLSPRVRGNLHPIAYLDAINRSIPACAGEPRGQFWIAVVSGVYPRVCGGTQYNRDRTGLNYGLSPRVRGNLAGGLGLRLRWRSIPACAGEPCGGWWRRWAMGVYPRVCGGTATAPATPAFTRGLSPRVRGNPLDTELEPRGRGSIPACAGEPCHQAGDVFPIGVYPRVCGGTSRLPCAPAAPPGLSPRVRGNLSNDCTKAAASGSIPACAGEPDVRTAFAKSRTVYPRVCGGTPFCRPFAPVRRGLSPRVRGNPDRIPGPCFPEGSIPACAGEPDSPSQSKLASKVYPRVCGGTDPSCDIQPPEKGLSPRVRGNLSHARPTA